MSKNIKYKKLLSIPLVLISINAYSEVYGDLIRLTDSNNFSLHQANFKVWKKLIDNNSTQADKDSSTFYLRRGLSEEFIDASRKCYSFESKKFPGYYIKHQNYRLDLVKPIDNTAYRGSATFCLNTDNTIESSDISGYKVAVNPKDSSVWLSSPTSIISQFANIENYQMTILKDDVSEQPLEPRNIIKSNTNFLLNSEEWLHIQRYTQNAFQLPTDLNSMRTQYNLPAKLTDVKKYEDLSAEYKKIYDNAYAWRHTKYPQIVDSAYLLKTYAKDFISYSEFISSYGNDFVLNGKSADAGVIAELLADLSATAKANRDKTSIVYQTLKSSLDDNRAYYQSLLKMQSKFSVNNLENKLKTKFNQLINARDTLYDVQNKCEVKHLSSSVKAVFSYTNVPLIGWIATPVTNDTYGVETANALKTVNQVDNEIAMLPPSQKHQIVSTNAFHQLLKNTYDVNHSYIFALESIVKIEENWQYIHNNLESLKEIINESGKSPEALSRAQAAVRKLGIAEATIKWKEVKEKAIDFTLYAYSSFK